ncbi:hypothetical protein JCM19231_2536 [Vibrio ishigakensis]|uniref:Uncharacterized protein n=1 Tax=Vibrio ishigakensis TaxID=1481914 RepID=A0A0B8NVF0_9VIBR|nr:hypothetical protein [Vibrio ishigakensis]GAM56282.1 hypothetical protein JCM19231_2536 [Vibrio ishigakensis]
MNNNLVKVVLVGVAVVLGFFAGDIYHSFKKDDSNLTYCEASAQGCTEQGVSVFLDSDVAKAMQPTEIEVDWPGQKSDMLLIELEGKEMNMGVAKFELSRDQGNKFTGTLLLPACHSEKMTWIGKVSSEQSPQGIPLLVRMER